jgi:hypothetical protein
VYISEEIKSSFCCHSVQDLLSSCVLPKTVNIKTYKTIILPAVLYGSDTWSLTFGEEQIDSGRE